MPCRSCGGGIIRTVEPQGNTAPQTAEQIRAAMPRRPIRRQVVPQQQQQTQAADKEQS